MPGPAVAMPELDPTNRPAPMTPPMAIIDRWRFLSPAWRPPTGGVCAWVSGDTLFSFVVLMDILE
ncbi:hypothetical protein GCM10023083_82710 [Streptomyces phyllanthi]